MLREFQRKKLSFGFRNLDADHNGLLERGLVMACYVNDDPTNPVNGVFGPIDA